MRKQKVFLKRPIEKIPSCEVLETISREMFDQGPNGYLFDNWTGAIGHFRYPLSLRLPFPSFVFPRLSLMVRHPNVLWCKMM
jgi:hypothetical protein